MRANRKSAESLRIAVLTIFALAIGLLSAPSRAQVASNAAIITSATGRVSLERSGELWAVTAGMSMNVEIGRAHV